VKLLSPSGFARAFTALTPPFTLTSIQTAPQGAIAWTASPTSFLCVQCACGSDYRTSRTQDAWWSSSCSSSSSSSALCTRDTVMSRFRAFHYPNRLPGLLPCNPKTVSFCHRRGSFGTSRRFLPTLPYSPRPWLLRPKGAVARRGKRHAMISEMVPAPTVRPPSRMAKRKPFSMATGVCSSISSEMLSPGITISVPAGSFAVPVTSVVRK
jgi:hypothetical protein